MTLRQAVIFFLAVVVFALGCYLGSRRKEKGQGEEAKACPDEVSLQVYRRLSERLRGYNAVSAWINKPTLEMLDRERAMIAEVRGWLQTADLDPCARREYEQWLDVYFERGLNEAYREVKTHDEEDHMRRYREAQKAQDERIRQRPPVPAPWDEKP